VRVGVGLGVRVGVLVGVSVGFGVRLGVGDGAGVLVGMGVGVGRLGMRSVEKVPLSSSLFSRTWLRRSTRQFIFQYAG